MSNILHSQASLIVVAVFVFHVPLLKNVKDTWRIVDHLPTVIPTELLRSSFVQSVLKNKIVFKSNEIKYRLQSNKTIKITCVYISAEIKTKLNMIRKTKLLLSQNKFSILNIIRNGIISF